MSINHKNAPPGLVALALLLAGHPAEAAIEGWYYGLSGGPAEAAISRSTLDEFAGIFFDDIGTPLLSGSSTLDDSDTAWSILFGYQFSPYFAAEAAYLDLGSYPYQFTGTADFPGSVPAGLGFEFETSGISVAGIGVLPLGYLFELHGRVGLFFADTKATFSARLDSESIVDKASQSTSDFFYGVGVSMNLGDNWSLRADWQQFKDVGDEDITTEADIDTLTLSVIYRLGPF